MPRFAILWHELPADSPRPSHWDFLLEAGDKLLTWALTDSPDSQAEQPAEKLADHRLDYLDYEGPISKNRGHVTRWDSGTYVGRHDTVDRLVVDVQGQRLQGQVVLVHDVRCGGWGYSFRDRRSPLRR